MDMARESLGKLTQKPLPSCFNAHIYSQGRWASSYPQAESYILWDHMRIPQAGRSNSSCKTHWTGGFYCWPLVLAAAIILVWGTCEWSLSQWLPPSFNIWLPKEKKIRQWHLCLPWRTSAMTSYQKGNLLDLQSDTCSVNTGSKRTRELGRKPYFSVSSLAA